MNKWYSSPRNDTSSFNILLSELSACVLFFSLAPSDINLLNNAFPTEAPYCIIKMNWIENVEASIRKCNNLANEDTTTTK